MLFFSQGIWVLFQLKISQKIDIIRADIFMLKQKETWNETPLLGHFPWLHLRLQPFVSSPWIVQNFNALNLGFNHCTLASQQRVIVAGP